VAVYKTTIFFQSNKFVSAGWTENWYLNADNIAGALGVVNASGYVQSRIRILSADYNLTHFRVTTVSPQVRGASRVTYLSTAASQGKLDNPADAEDPSEQPYDALLVRLDLTIGRRRSLLLRGLPTGLVTRVTGYAQTDWWGRPWGVFTRTLSDPTFPLLIRTSTLGTLLSWDTVAINPIDNRSLVFTLAGGPPAGYVVGATFKVTSPAFSPNLTGLYRIRVVGATTIQTVPGRVAFQPFAGVSLPLTQLVTYDYNPPTQVTPLRGVKKSTGRPFDLLRGRRSPRKR
jgi:hypothetical protein